MNTTQQQMAAIFNEWARRYSENPDEFGAILDADGRPVEDYGQRCAIYFEEIAKDMNFPVILCEGERTAEAIQAATVATALVPHNVLAQGREAGSLAKRPSGAAGYAPVVKFSLTTEQRKETE